MDINILKTQAKELTGSLRDLGNKKEQKYREKTKLGGVLNKLIKEAVDLNARKKEIEKELSSLKKERNNKNKEVREGLKKLKQVIAQHVRMMHPENCHDPAFNPNLPSGEPSL